MPTPTISHASQGAGFAFAVLLHCTSMLLGCNLSQTSYGSFRSPSQESRLNSFRAVSSPRAMQPLVWTSLCLSRNFLLETLSYFRIASPKYELDSARCSGASGQTLAILADHLEVRSLWLDRQSFRPSTRLWSELAQTRALKTRVDSVFGSDSPSTESAASFLPNQISSHRFDPPISSIWIQASQEYWTSIHRWRLDFPVTHWHNHHLASVPLRPVSEVLQF